MVTQNRSVHPHIEHATPDDWAGSPFMPLSLAEIQELLGAVAGAGLKASALAVFCVLLIHADCLGRVSCKVKRLAKDTNLEPDSVRGVLRKLKQAGEIEVITPGSGGRAPWWRIARLRGLP